MYPRNSASPPRISIGPVVQISDGAVQTSGCTVRILPEGGAEGDGGGTTAYSTDGVVLYTPTQAETNYTAFVLIAKKTGCIPATVTIVTTASAVAGSVKPADGSIVTATFGTCVTPETAKTAHLPAVDAGAASGLPLLDASAHLLAYSVSQAIVLPTIPNNWLAAAGIAANALNGKGDWLLASGYTAPDNADVASILAIVGSGTYGNAVLLAGLGSVYAIVNSGTYGNDALLTTIQARATPSRSPARPTGWRERCGMMRSREPTSPTV